MANHVQGIVLTCSHGDCGCRVRIESECHCAGAGGPYVCTCGAPLVELADDSSELTGSSAG